MMFDIDKQSQVQSKQNDNDSFISVSEISKNQICDISVLRQTQYIEDARDYINLNLKKDSFVDNIAEDHNIFTINKEDNFPSQTGMTASLKQIQLVKALSKRYSKRDAKLSDKNFKEKQSLRFIKPQNGSCILDRDESTPKRYNLDNSESNLKYLVPSAFDTSIQPNLFKHKSNFEIGNQNFTGFCADINNTNDQKMPVGDNQEYEDQDTFDNINRQQRNTITDQKKNPQKENKLKSILSNFNKLNMIKKFVKKMTGLSPQYNYKKLKEFHFEVIGDIVQIISQQFIKSKRGSSYFILQPNELFSIVWEVIEIIFLFFHVIAFGFRFGFGILLNEYVQLFSIIFFILDLLVIMNTGYYSGIEIVTDRIKILKYNSFSIFMIIISLVALVFSDQGPVQFVFIFRIRQLYRSYNHFEQNFQIKQKHPVSATLVRLFLIIILLAHYNACGFYFFTQNFNNDEQSWLSFYGIQNSSWEAQYITTLYFSFITMVTVGYGDVVPKTLNERVYIIFFVLISAITFAYVVNTIGTLFQELSRQEGKFNQKKFEIMNYMEERNISKSIQISVVKFLEYTIKQEKELQYSLAGESFLQSIPLKLRQQVYQEYYGRILQEIKLFSMNFSKDFLNQISVLMKEKTYGPGEEIFKQGDKNNTFFFINKGQIEFDIELQGKNTLSLGILKKGDSFNHKGLFIDYVHEISARCKQITQIIFLNQEDFQRVLKQNKDEYEKYCMIKDKFFQDSFSLGEKCLSCSEFNHSVLSCKFIKYSPNKYNLIAKNQYSVRIIERTPHKRKTRKNVKQSLRLLRLELTYMLMGQKIGSFSQLAEQDLSDEQFYKFFPQLSYDTERFIHISSVDDLNRSFDDQDIESIGNHVQQNHQQQPFKRESAVHDTFLLKIRNNNETHQQIMSSLSNQQSLTKLPPHEESSVLSPNIKKTKKNTDDIQSSSDESSDKEENQKQENQKPDITIRLEGLQRKTSIKVLKENQTQPGSKPVTPVNRRLSTLQGSVNMFQSQQGNNSFHNIMNYNQHPSHSEFNIPYTPSSLAPPDNFVANNNSNNSNQMLSQMMNQLQQILSNTNIQTLLSGNHNANYSNQGKYKNQNIRSLTHIHKDHVNQNHNQSLQKLPTHLHSPSGVGEIIDKEYKFYLNYDFDLLKEYKYYFPSMNFSSVRQMFLQLQDKKFAKIRQTATSIFKKK